MTDSARSTGLRAIQYLLSLAVLVAVWEVYVRLTSVPSFLLPTPGATLAALSGLGWSGLVPHIGYTLGNLLAGFFLGSTAALAAGVALHRMPRLESTLSGPVLFLQTAPKIALAPLFVIWFGLGAVSKIALIVSLVFFPVMVGTLAGLKNVDPRLLDLAKLVRLGPSGRLFRIELPSALPEVFVGLKIGVVQAVVGAILAEWMAGKLGLGYLMTYSIATYKTPLLFGAVGLTVVLGIIVYFILDTFERRLFAWRELPR